MPKLHIALSPASQRGLISARKTKALWSPAAPGERGEQWPQAYDPSFTATPQEAYFQIASAKVYYRASGVEGKKVTIR